ncbi:MAG: transglycosylase SLT domain-containing protein [Bacteroidota bacterium]
MRIFGPRKSLENQQGFYIVPRSRAPKKGNHVRAISIFGILLFVSNIFTYSWFGSSAELSAAGTTVNQQLYLLDEAGRFIPETKSFEKKVHQIANELQVPPEWLMAVMYSESRFNPGVSNARGSGAVGLIQFMVPTVKELNVRMGTKYYMKDILAMTATEQMELVAEYFQTNKERYGAFQSLTDFYLAVLYPKARKQDYCYTLYSKPAQAYLMNSGLDENKDGRVTVSDIDKRMQRMFPTAYMAKIGREG